VLTDTDKEIASISRGVHAEKLLKDSLLIEAFETVKQALTTKWESSPVRDKEAREYLYLMIKATNDARGYLEQAVRDGKVTVHSKEQRRLFSMFKR
jgi:hypothetical protein